MVVLIAQPTENDNRLKEITEILAIGFNKQIISLTLNGRDLAGLGDALCDLSKCDLVYFAKGWEKNLECSLIRKCAELYGKDFIEE